MLVFVSEYFLKQKPEVHPDTVELAIQLTEVIKSELNALLSQDSKS